jgi:hypothetical protein
MELTMKTTAIETLSNPSSISDSRDVLPGNLPTANIADGDKVRVGNMTPAFPANVADSGKVRVGNMSPAFPPGR